MNQAAAIQLKSPAPTRKRGSGKKFFLGLLLFTIAFAGFFCWRHFNHFRHGRVSHAVPAAVKSVKPALAATSPKTDSHPAVAKSEQPVATKAKAAAVGFADSLMAVLSPSAKGATVQQEMPPAPKPAAESAMPSKRIPLQAVAAPLPVRKPQVLTVEQKRLQVAQDGFDHVMDRAIRHPDAYGFLPDENLGDATLGKEIPIYTIGSQDGRSYAGQRVSSLLKPSDEWLYPVVLGNHVRYLVLVKYDGHDYVLEDGSRALAMDYNKILERWPASKGFHPQLITVPGLPSYYFTIPELPEQNITDTSRILDYDASLSPASIVLADLQ